MTLTFVLNFAHPVVSLWYLSLAANLQNGAGTVVVDDEGSAATGRLLVALAAPELICTTDSAATLFLPTRER
jgi:hypothetical protein